MTREEAILCLSVHSSTNGSGLCTDEQHYEAKQMAIKALEQQPCSDAISRQAAIEGLASIAKAKARSNAQKAMMGRTMFFVEQLPSVSTEKTGRWILVQRGKYVDVNCSKCGFSRIKDFAYNYTVEDISEQEFRDFVEKNKMNFCECCGAKMEVEDG